MSMHTQGQKCSREDLYRLIKQYQNEPTEDVQNCLIIQFKEMVQSLASRFARGRESVDDLSQVGMIGLLAALRRYDETFGRNFESFAVPTIVGEIKRYIRDKTWSVHVPRRIKELSPRIRKAVETLTTELQRSPQISDIAAFLHVSEEDVLEAMEMGRSYQALSMDSEIDADQEGSAMTLLDLVGRADEGYQRIERELMLAKVLHVLNEREKEIIQLTFYQNLSQKQAGELLGISQMHVSRLQRRALMKLREAMRIDSADLVER